MGNAILRQETVEVLRECVLIAEEMHLFPLSTALVRAGFAQNDDIRDPRKARFMFDGVLKAINWTDRRSVLPIIPIFEDAYAESPQALHTIHQRIDTELAHDGFQIKEGRLMRLPL